MLFDLLYKGANPPGIITDLEVIQSGVNSAELTQIYSDNNHIENYVIVVKEPDNTRRYWWPL